jgi:hypothetical protein
MDKTPQFSDESEQTLDPKTKKFIDDIIRVCHKHKLVLVSEHVNGKMVITKLTAPSISHIKNAETDFKKIIKKAPKKEEKTEQNQKSKANFKFYKNNERKD